ncbi:MAG: AraC family transcriptional regulator [Alistipes sp.]|nr:AraC family transcriptional regulator [Alistipes sp.]
MASELGFSSHAFFTRYFKQKTGVTPEAYRTRI